MKDKLISRICDSESSDRDCLVDELNDEIEAEYYSREQTLSIVRQLLALLPTEADQAVHESILNLLSGIYPLGIGDQEIEKYVLQNIHHLEPGSLIHALSILSESKLDERKEILFTFTHSDNKAIQKVAENYLSGM